MERRLQDAHAGGERLVTMLLRHRVRQPKHRRTYRRGAHDLNKFVQPRPYANPEAAARKIIEIANSLEPYMDDRLMIELINAPMLYQHKATPAEYKAGLDLAVAKGWLELHESGTFVRFTQDGKDLFA